MFYVYLLESKKYNNFYFGCTNNLRRRLNEHNQGSNPSTKPYAPYKIIYFEAYINQNDAYKREKILKGQWGRKYINRVLKNYFKSSNRTSASV